MILMVNVAICSSTMDPMGITVLYLSQCVPCDPHVRPTSPCEIQHCDEANSSALAACAAWTFPSAPPEGWAISCAQARTMGGRAQFSSTKDVLKALVSKQNMLDVQNLT